MAKCEMLATRIAGNFSAARDFVVNGGGLATVVRIAVAALLLGVAPSWLCIYGMAAVSLGARLSAEMHGGARAVAGSKRKEIIGRCV